MRFILISRTIYTDLFFLYTNWCGLINELSWSTWFTCFDRSYFLIVTTWSPLIACRASLPWPDGNIKLEGKGEEETMKAPWAWRFLRTDSISSANWIVSRALVSFNQISIASAQSASSPRSVCLFQNMLAVSSILRKYRTIGTHRLNHLLIVCSMFLCTISCTLLDVNGLNWDFNVGICTDLLTV